MRLWGVILGVLLASVVHAQSYPLAPGQSVLVTCGSAVATPTGTTVPTSTPAATPTPVGLNPFSTVSVPNNIPGWPINLSQAIFWNVFDLRTVKSVNVFANSVKIPNQQFGQPAGSNSWVYLSQSGSVQGTLFYAPTTLGPVTFSFVAYGSLDTSQPLNIPSASAVPPTSITRTVVGSSSKKKKK